MQHCRASPGQINAKRTGGAYENIASGAREGSSIRRPAFALSNPRRANIVAVDRKVSGGQGA